jgi:hypothetical protein
MPAAGRLRVAESHGRILVALHPCEPTGLLRRNVITLNSEGLKKMNEAFII